MVKEFKNFDISYKGANAKDFVWGLPFLKIKREILGADFICSLNFIDEDEAQKLNIDYRKKDYTPNVLSFPLDKNCGEIYICKKAARSQYKDFEMTYRNYIIFLFIHGCLHLSGVDHTTTRKEDSMVKLEYGFLEKYKR